MKQAWVLLSVVILFFTTSAAAEEPSKEKLIELAKVTGIYEQIEQQKVAIQQQGAQAAQQYAQQISASFPDLPSEFNQEMEKEFSVFIGNIAGLIDTDFAVNSYITLIANKLDADEVEGIIKFYSSDLGKKYTQSNIEISGDWVKEFMGDFDKKLMVHLQTFGQNLSAKAASYSNTQ